MNHPLEGLNGTEEIVELDGKRCVRRANGDLLDLSTLSDTMYWQYMTERERSWYDPTLGGEAYQG